MKATGTKTATTARVTASTASAISAVPFSAATSGLSPCSRWRTMFSMTTMASSMSRPMERVSASMVTMLKVKPSAFITANVPMMAVGSATADTSVERTLRRKMRTTTTARMPPRIMSSWTEAMEERMNFAPSTTMTTRLPLGSCPSIPTRAALTRSATWTVLAPDCLRTTRPMALRSPRAAELRGSAGPSSTRATSPRRTGVPMGLATMRARSASTVRASAATFTDRSTPVSRVRPPGTSMLWARSAWTTSDGVRP